MARRSMPTLVWIALAGCSPVREGVSRASTDIGVDPEGCVADIAPLRAGVMRGMSFAHSWQAGGERGYGSPVADHSLEELGEHGVDWVSLTPFAFQQTLADDELRTSATMPSAESEERVRRQIEQAHARSMHVLLKPHVWIGSGEWCARIEPRGGDVGWRRWWRSYESFVLAWARVAAATGVEALAVGTELSSAVAADPDAMRHLVAEVRAIYAGKLVYAANWDEVDRVRFWDALDYVGVQLYAPLARRADETDASMSRRFTASLARVAATADRVHRPLVVTEIGYTATARALLAPHAWPENLRGTEADVQAQARAYRIALGALGAHPKVAGVFFWKWFTDPDADEEGTIGFSPRGRPASAVMASAFGARRCRAAAR